MSKRTNYSHAFSALAILSGRVDDSAYYAELRSFALSNDAETIRVFCERDLATTTAALVKSGLTGDDLATATATAIASAFRPLERFLAIAGGKKQDAVAKHAAGKRADAAPTVPGNRADMSAIVSSPDAIAALMGNAPLALTNAAPTVATDAAPPVATDAAPPVATDNAPAGVAGVIRRPGRAA